MRKNKITIFIITAFLFFLFQSPTFAEENWLTTVSIDQQTIVGTTSESGMLTIKQQNKSLGTMNVLAGKKFQFDFQKKITASSITLSLIDNNNGQYSKTVQYSPVKTNIINDKDRILKGTAVQANTVKAYIGKTELHLKKWDKRTGSFEFSPSTLLKKDTQIKIISIHNTTESISYTKVAAAPAPKKPIVKGVSNKNIALTGTAEKNSTVYAQFHNKTYSTKLGNSTAFTLALPNKKPLAAGTKIKLYVVDSVNRKSGTVTITVQDKTPPTVPKVKTVTNKSFTLSGSTEKLANVYIKKGSKIFKKGKANAKGTFSFRFPLQTSNTKLTVYAVDAAGNKSKQITVTIKNKAKPKKKVISTPVVSQMPELARGCEVTSLSMLLRHAGVKVDKMTLAKSIKKDPTKLKKKNGKKYYGNPNTGFVGNIYTFSKPGFAVYHKPIENLANKYLPNRIINLTGNSFNKVEEYVAAGHPVWIITTSWFSYVPKQYWETWYTPTGKIKMTYKEHSVLITGYDNKYVYFNDPLDGTKNKKKLKKSFIDGWKQFGNQAISYY